MTRKYSKAYYLKDVRQYSNWSEKREEGAPELSDDDVVYIWDDFIVVKSPVLPDGVIFDNVTSEWQNFCTTTLEFKIPEDLLYAYEQESTSEEEYAKEGSKTSL